MSLSVHPAAMKPQIMARVTPGNAPSRFGAIPLFQLPRAFKREVARIRRLPACASQQFSFWHLGLVGRVAPSRADGHLFKILKEIQSARDGATRPTN
jgi:hypothetical protein